MPRPKSANAKSQNPPSKAQQQKVRDSTAQDGTRKPTVRKTRGASDKSEQPPAGETVLERITVVDDMVRAPQFHVETGYSMPDSVPFAGQSPPPSLVCSQPLNPICACAVGRNIRPPTVEPALQRGRGSWLAYKVRKVVIFHVFGANKLPGSPESSPDGAASLPEQAKRSESP